MFKLSIAGMRHIFTVAMSTSCNKWTLRLYVAAPVCKQREFKVELDHLGQKGTKDAFVLSEIFIPNWVVI